MLLGFTLERAYSSAPSTGSCAYRGKLTELPKPTASTTHGVCAVRKLISAIKRPRNHYHYSYGGRGVKSRITGDEQGKCP